MLMTPTYKKMNSFYLLHIYLPSICNVDYKYKIKSQKYKDTFKASVFKMLKELDMSN